MMPRGIAKALEQCVGWFHSMVRVYGLSKVDE